MVRSFIAIDIPENVSQKMVDINRYFLERNYRPVSANNIHLTLKFLGETDEQMLRQIYEKLRSVLNKHQIFNFSISGLGAFPSERNARVLWFGVKEGADRIISLAEDVQSVVQEFNIAKLERFVPHITIGRFKRPSNISREIEGIRKSGLEVFQVTANSVKIFKSTLTPKGPIYEVLYSIELKSVP
ncbi:MAG: RNA 2',3'-cyclic phosphodiesterase [Actinobacteria bacterium]|nr:RNA 2',3'-cyclic phosphodiesterase [Actinomycetota bacterium]